MPPTPSAMFTFVAIGPNGKVQDARMLRSIPLLDAALH